MGQQMRMSSAASYHEGALPGLSVRQKYQLGVHASH